MEERLKLMIVDDEPFMREGLKVYLDWPGYHIHEIVTAEDGAGALELARRERPDLLITDIRMPEMSGLMLYSGIKEFLPDCVCIIISAYNDFEYAKKSVELGAYYYIVKPIELEELQTVVSGAVELILKRRSEKAALRRLQERSSKSKRLLIHNLLSKLLLQQDGIGAPQFAAAAGELRMDFAYPCYSVCVLRPCSKKLLSRPAADGVFSMAEGMAYQHLSCRLQGQANLYCLPAGNRLILVMGAHRREVIAGETKALMENIERSAGGCFGVGITAALGQPVACVTDLYLCRCEADRLCDGMAFFRNRGFFQVGSSPAPSLQSPFLITAAEKGSLLAMVAKNDPEGLSRLLTALRERLWEPACQDKDVLFSGLLELMICAARILDEKRIELRRYLNVELFTYDFLETFGDVDQLFQWLMSFFAILANAGDNREDAELESRLTEQIKRYTREYLCENLNLSRIAEYFHYNCNYLGRLFKRVEGKKYSEYINELRVERSCRLLRETRLSVEEVAVRVGYSDAQYFIKVFKARMGVTPRRYKSVCPPAGLLGEGAAR